MKKKKKYKQSWFKMLKPNMSEKLFEINMLIY